MRTNDKITEIKATILRILCKRLVLWISWEKQLSAKKQIMNKKFPSIEMNKGCASTEKQSSF